MNVNNGRSKPTRLFSIIGFAVLSTLFGVGLAWVSFALWAGASKRDFTTTVDSSVPFMLGGATLGLSVGLAIAIWVSRSGLKIEEKIIARFVRRGDRLRIYGGAPFAVSIGLFFLLLPHLERIVGSDVGPYVALGVFLAIQALGLFLYDRIPPKYIIPIGVIGWLLIVAAAVVFGVLGLHAGAAFDRVR